jgi:hypothetical protein
MTAMSASTSASGKMLSGPAAATVVNGGSQKQPWVHRVVRGEVLNDESDEVELVGGQGSAGAEPR